MNFCEILGAARKGHTAIIQLLLQTGQVNVNTADFKGDFI